MTPTYLCPLLAWITAHSPENHAQNHARKGRLKIGTNNIHILYLKSRPGACRCTQPATRIFLCPHARCSNRACHGPHHFTRAIIIAPFIGYSCSHISSRFQNFALCAFVCEKNPNVVGGASLQRLHSTTPLSPTHQSCSLRPLAASPSMSC
jgi:hypothetical protein